jgi:hypothetical protein
MRDVSWTETTTEAPANPLASAHRVRPVRIYGSDQATAAPRRQCGREGMVIAPALIRWGRDETP